MPTDTESMNANAKGWLEHIEQMLAALETTDDNEREDARDIITQSVLSVSVRDGWRSPGSLTDEGPEEYEILLSTGGPALRIYGSLSKYAEPETAELQMQDWNTPWTRDAAPEHVLLHFAQQFFFGE